MRSRAAAAAAATAAESSPPALDEASAPAALAEYLCRWALAHGPARVLVPYVGAGAPFLRAIARASTGSSSRPPGRRASFVVDAVVSDGARPRGRAGTAGAASAAGVVRALRAAGAVAGVTQGRDFFAWLAAQPASARWDAVVGCPPTGPLSRLPAPVRARAAALCTRAGVPLGRGAAAWVPFVVAAVARLSPGGRLAMLLPADVLDAAHAEGLRQLLERVTSAVTVVSVRRARADQTPAVLLFATRQRTRDMTAAAARRDEDDPAAGTRLRALEVDVPAHLPPLDALELTAREAAAPLAGRWTRAWLSAGESALLAQVERARWARPFATLATVEPARGNVVAVGGGGSNGVVGAAGGADHGAARPRAAPFVALLARARTDPRLWCARADAPARGGAVYRVRLAPGLSRRRAHLVFSFVNSLTLLEAELEGRRDAGGGLVLGPREIARLRVPLAEPTRADLAALDALLRRGAGAEAILAFTDPRTLGRAGVGGLSAHAIATLRGAWARLRARRLQR